MALLKRIPYEAVDGAHKAIPLFQEQHEFNTAKHTFEEIHTVIPDIPHNEPTQADWIIVRPWLDLIIRSQRLHRSDVHSFALPKTFIDALDFIQPRAIRLGGLDDEDVEELAAKFPESSNEGTALTDISTWYFFARLDTTSLKDSLQGLKQVTGQRNEILPIESLQDLFLRLLTSDRAMGAMHNYLHEVSDSEPFNLYLFPFNARLRIAHEYRVFCCPSGGAIAAISQYEWHQRWLYADSDEVKQQAVANAVLEGCQRLHEQIMNEPAMTPHLKERGFVFDVLYDPDDREVRLIELNEFGALTGCGSGLYHWIRDAPRLYGKGKGVEFRVAA